LTHLSQIKPQIAIEGFDREIRVPNTLHDGSGKEVALKQGAEVDVTIEAAANAIPERTRPNPSQREKAESDGKLTESLYEGHPSPE
jgi:hypothetical protein